MDITRTVRHICSFAIIGRGVPQNESEKHAIIWLAC